MLFRKSTGWLLVSACLLFVSLGEAWPAEVRRSPRATSAASNKTRQDDSVILHPPKDLALQPDGERKVRALLDYVRALDLQDDGEAQKALEAFERVLNIDPGEGDLATRVAYLLTEQGD